MEILLYPYSCLESLENNAIGVEGATALAVALRTNATLTHLK